jgi:hypothetical protein
MLAQTRSFLIRLLHGKATRKHKRNSLKSAPRSSVKAVRPVDSSESAALTPLNFKVPQEFHRDFKTFAAQHSKKMVEVLQEAFVLLKEKYGK